MLGCMRSCPFTVYSVSPFSSISWNRVFQDTPLRIRGGLGAPVLDLQHHVMLVAAPRGRSQRGKVTCHVGRMFEKLNGCFKMF